eukprot:IDg12935t1
MSEISWEALEHMLDVRLHLISEPISASLIAQNAFQYAAAVHEKSNCLPNCVGFIDGTAIGIARPKDPDGLILHVYGPVEGRRHDWTVYTRSGLGMHLPTILEVNEQKYCIFGESGYNRRWFMEIPYQGSNLVLSSHHKMLLSNMKNCFYHNQVSKYFKCAQPTLQEYLAHND